MAGNSLEISTGSCDHPTTTNMAERGSDLCGGLIGAIPGDEPELHPSFPARTKTVISFTQLDGGEELSRAANRNNGVALNKVLSRDALWQQGEEHTFMPS